MALIHPRHGSASAVAVRPAKEKFFCSLCKLDYTTRRELNEHNWSMLHHRKLSKDRGENYVHRCSLCSKEAVGLLEFCKHIHGELHRRSLKLWKDSQIVRPGNKSGEKAPEKVSQPQKGMAQSSPSYVAWRQSLDHTNSEAPSASRITVSKLASVSTAEAVSRDLAEVNVEVTKQSDCSNKRNGLISSRRNISRQNSKEEISVEAVTSTAVSANSTGMSISAARKEQMGARIRRFSDHNGQPRQVVTSAPVTSHSLSNCNTAENTMSSGNRRAPSAPSSGKAAASHRGSAKEVHPQTSVSQVVIKHEIIDSDDDDGDNVSQREGNLQYKPCSFKKTDSEQCTVLTDKRFCPYHLSVIAAVKSHITTATSQASHDVSDVVALISRTPSNSPAMSVAESSNACSSSAVVKSASSGKTLQAGSQCVSSDRGPTSCESPVQALTEQTSVHSLLDAPLAKGLSFNLSGAVFGASTAPQNTVSSSLSSQRASAVLSSSLPLANPIPSSAPCPPSAKEMLRSPSGSSASCALGSGPSSSFTVTALSKPVASGSVSLPMTSSQLRTSATLSSHGKSADTRSVNAFFDNLLSTQRQTSVPLSVSKHQSSQSCILTVSSCPGTSFDSLKSAGKQLVTISSSVSKHHTDHSAPICFVPSLSSATENVVQENAQQRGEQCPLIDLNGSRGSMSDLDAMHIVTPLNADDRRKRHNEDNSVGAVRKRPRLEGVDMLLLLENREDEKIRELGTISTGVSNVRDRIQLLYMELDVLLAKETKANKELSIIRQQRRKILLNAASVDQASTVAASVDQQASTMAANSPDIQVDQSSSISYADASADRSQASEKSGVDRQSKRSSLEKSTASNRTSSSSSLLKSTRIEDMKQRIKHLKSIVEHSRSNQLRKDALRVKKVAKSRVNKRKRRRVKVIKSQDVCTPASKTPDMAYPPVHLSDSPTPSDQVAKQPPRNAPRAESGQASAVHSEFGNTLIAENFGGHTGPITALVIDGGYVCSSATDRKIGLFNVCSGQGLLFDSGHKQAISSMEVVMEKHYSRLCTGSNDRTVRVHCPVKLRCLRKFIFSARVLALHAAFGILYVALADGNVSFISIERSVFLKKVLCHSTAPSAVSCLTSGTVDGKRVFCTGSFDKTITCRSAKEGSLLHVINDHQAKVLCVKAHEERIFSGSADSVVLMHCLKTGNLLHRFPPHMHGITGVHVCGEYLLTSSLDKLIRCFLISDGSLKHVYGGHNSMIFCMCMFGMAKIFSGSQDGTISSIHLTHGKPHPCQWKDCALPFAQMDHLKQHLKDFHYNSRFPVFCRWENCRHRFMGKPTDNEIMEHLDMHTKQMSSVGGQQTTKVQPL